MNPLPSPLTRLHPYSSPCLESESTHTSDGKANPRTPDQGVFMNFLGQLAMCLAATEATNSPERSPQSSLGTTETLSRSKLHPLP